MSNLSFTLSQMENHAKANAKVWEFIFAFRRECDIRIGTSVSARSFLLIVEACRIEDDLTLLQSVFTKYIDSDIDLFDIYDLVVCLKSEVALEDLKLALKALRDGCGSMKEVRHARAKFIGFLSQVQP